MPLNPDCWPLSVKRPSGAGFKRLFKLSRKRRQDDLTQSLCSLRKPIALLRHSATRCQRGRYRRAAWGQHLLDIFLGSRMLLHENDAMEIDGRSLLAGAFRRRLRCLCQAASKCRSRGRRGPTNCSSLPGCADRQSGPGFCLDWRSMDVGRQ